MGMAQVCGICGRALSDWRTAASDDPAMDCGGDCLACMADLERWLREDVKRYEGDLRKLAAE
jgi:hypothetical protein